MEFNINEFIKNVGLKKIILIIFISIIIFFLLPTDFIEYVGGKISQESIWKKIITFIIILIINTFIIELIYPLFEKIYSYFEKVLIIKKLDNKHFEYITKFYDYDVEEFIKNVSVYGKDKYISSLVEKGIIEWVTPLIITSSTPNTYKISSEYKKILKKYMKKL